MAFDQYRFDSDKFKKLPFIGELYLYNYVNANKEVKQGALFEVSFSDYEKIKERLKGDDKTDIVTGDKVYVLPGCSIPQFKIKEFLKGIGARMVTSFEEATKIVGNKKVSHEMYTDPTNSSLLRAFPNLRLDSKISDDTVRWLGQWHGTSKVSHAGKTARQIVDEKFEALIKQKFDADGYIPKDTIIANDVCTALNMRDYGCKIHDTHYFITPTCGLLLHYILYKKVPVVSEDHVFTKIDKPLVIDESIYDSLCSMLNSPDKANQAVAIELISNCDIDGSFYYLWKIARSHYNELMEFRRQKNFRLFVEKFDVYTYHRRSEKRIIPELHEKGILTPEIYKELITEVIKDYQHKILSSLFTVTLKPSSEYLKYAPELEVNISTPEKVEEPVQEE